MWILVLKMGPAPTNLRGVDSYNTNWDAYADIASEFMPNYLQFIGATMGASELNIQTDNGQVGMPSNVCCVVVEYCPGGALKSYLIKNRRKKLAFKVVVQLALDLARGLYSQTLSIYYMFPSLDFGFS